MNSDNPITSDENATPTPSVSVNSYSFTKKAKPTLWSRLKTLSKLQKILLSVIALLLTAGVLVMGVLFGTQSTTISSPLNTCTPQVNQEEPRTEANPLNGILYKKSEAKSWQDKSPIAVMVENLVDIRPQSGLSRADIVYEALAEGGITRFMAVYLGENMNEIGPIRSARPYYIDWALELNALYAHIGGSPSALEKISAYNVRELPEERPFYIRKSDTGTGVEHTAFSSTKGLWEMAQDHHYTSSPSIQSWKFKDDASSSARPVSSSIKLGFSGQKDYAASWDYDQETNTYRRSNGTPAKPQIDTVNNENLNAKDVIVQYTTTTNLRDDKSRIDVQTTGTGEAKIFLDGGVIEGTWKKDSASSRTRFYDKNSVEIEFNRGKIWVEVVPTDSSVEYS